MLLFISDAFFTSGRNLFSDILEGKKETLQTIKMPLNCSELEFLTLLLEAWENLIQF